MSGVWVEIGENGFASRIFRNHKQAVAADLPIGHVALMSRRQATSQIRRQVFESQARECKWCGDLLTFTTMHLHEIIHRGQGGETSLDNSIVLCAKCHLQDAHGDRNPQFGSSLSGQKEDS